jgi:hypothetical protein
VSLAVPPLRSTFEYPGLAQPLLARGFFEVAVY